MKIIKDAFKKYFVVGIITVLPFAITLKIILFVIDYFEGILEIHNERFLYFIPAEFHPDRVFGFHIPLLGFVLTALIVLLIGVLSRNYFGTKLLRWVDRSMTHLPGLGGVYALVKQATETFSHSKNQFSRVVLVPYPHSESYTLAFVTGKAPHEIQRHFDRQMLNLFVPTTPNPTSGFYLIVPEEIVKNVDINVEDAFKLILTAGVVSNENKRREEIDIRR